MGYWEQIDYLGVGPSAVSTIEGYRWENVKSITEYYEKVTKYNKVRLTEEDVLKEFIMLRLRTSRGLSLKEYSKRTGKNFWRQHHKIINVLHKNNLIRIRNGYLSLTKNGFLVSNAIIEKFFP
jgi:oxygen-independent coproporphyrinogen-3 oxidase